MRALKTYLVWLILPALLLAGAMIFAPVSTDENISDESFTDLVYVKTDTKLDRTVNKWMGDHTSRLRPAYLGTPGLPIEMFINTDEWQALQKKINRRSFKKSRKTYQGQKLQSRSKASKFTTNDLF